MCLVGLEISQKNCMHSWLRDKSEKLYACKMLSDGALYKQTAICPL